MTSRVGGSRRYWLRLFACAVAIIVVIDASLLAMGTGLVSGGFGSPAGRNPLSLVGYVFGSALLDSSLVMLAWLLAYPLLRRFGGGPIRCASLALIVAVAPSALFAVLTYRVHSVLGGLVRAKLLTLATPSIAHASAVVVEEWLSRLDIAIFLAVTVLLMLVPLLARHFESRTAARAIGIPSFSTFLASALVISGLSTATLAASVSGPELLRLCFDRKASNHVLFAAIELTTDWDRDGYGWLSRPRDPDPVDALVHPYATEIPGNGIDENGLAGDGPPRTSLAASEARPVEPARLRPNILFVFLEGFRPELLDTEIDGVPVTPFLTRLAGEHGSSKHAFVHTPWTLQSRDALFRGQIDENRGGRSLVDDLKDRGYFVALFSGQDDSYGDSAKDLGFDRADVFYDARQDVDKRTTRSAVSVSLQISWKTLLDRTLDFLAGFEPGDQPLFLYFNIVDTHFPYTHDEIDEIVASPELPRSAIREKHADRIFRTYANSAANVDRAIERLVSAWRERFPADESVLLVTADHGEAFYEQGTLGHGQSVAALETRIPLIVRGSSREWPEPIAISDLRGLLLDELAENDSTVGPGFRPDPNKRIFQYLGQLEEPDQIALRNLDGTVVLDIHANVGWRLGPNDERLSEAPAYEEIKNLVWTWEALQREQRESVQRVAR